MIRVTLVVRELNREKPDFSLLFDLPEVPRIGDYVSIFRLDSTTHSEDVIVRHVWWHLHYPENQGSSSGAEKVGRLQDVMIECDVAIGPCARDEWRVWADAGKTRGANVERFKVARFSVPESDMNK
jgi:hypothetical protein